MVTRAFKTDESFLEKISIGAIGARKVFEDLKHSGHKPIELERGSMNYKIWKNIKIKRVRVPDILCLKCGVRVESRAKTKLEITMSHSTSSPDRGWDAGLNDDDYIAFVRCIKIGEAPIDWQASDLIQYVNVVDCKKSFQKGKIIRIEPKGATEGFEQRITWPSAIASSSGVVSEINSKRIQFKRLSDNRIISLSLKKGRIKLSPLVAVKKKVEEDQFIASVVPVQMSFACNCFRSEAYYVKMLSSPSISERYAACKALGYLYTKGIKSNLVETMENEKDHIYIRLEAAASLFKNNQLAAKTYFDEVLKGEYLENKLEAVIILGEIKNSESLKMLVSVLSDDLQNHEIRAGAAWALGELQNELAMVSLVNAFNNVQEPIRIEAARALSKLAQKHSNSIIANMDKMSPDQLAGVSWALSKSGSFDISAIMKKLSTDDLRRWIAWIIGTQDKSRFISEIEKLEKQDPEVYFAVTVLWQVLASWTNGMEIY